MIIDICKNPIVIALLTGTLTWLYIWWSNEQKYKKDPEAKKSSGVLMPLIVTAITFILAYGYNEMTGVNSQMQTSAPLTDINNISLADTRMYKLAKDANAVMSSESAKEFHLIGKGLNIPNNLKLPDVFIETI
jgi:hypothetical protein